MTAKEIRQAYLDFFKNKKHQIVPSAPIVVKNDPTLMFTNAGMNQFKDLFLGESAVKYARIADTQRCLRVSGKHNDLEEVGIDTYHHTMFEMLGNWSFGDYFKQEAIAWSWELLTEVYKIPKDKLYVSVFKGDETEGLPMDTEAFEIWKQFVPENRIILGNKKDNFWEMGDTGPCGPCSEIHVDCRSDAEKELVSGYSLVNADHPQVIEIWNNVFMQFNRLKDGVLQPLPAKHVDTGMGFERLVRVLQNKTSNYDTDIFQPLIQFIEQKSGFKYHADAQPQHPDWNQAVAMRVMADHIRAIAFVIADGQLPSNNKAGYVIRRILRRAVRYAYTFLDFKEPFLNQLVPVLAHQFEGVFDELAQQKDFVQKVILEEEVSFLRTLATGILRFEKYKAINQIIDGQFAFELYDTFGFPIDLTELMAREKGWRVDMQGFELALAEQKSRSRLATHVDNGDWIIVNQDNDTEFIGYDSLACKTQILKYREVNVKGVQHTQLVFDKTPFYAEGGGQVGDTGLMMIGGEEIKIIDTKKENGVILHFVNQLSDIPEGEIIVQVDTKKRILTENNHSATHLLHAALKQVLGTHVNQKGSLVNADYLRFDFSHFAKITNEELLEIERIVNAKIRENIPLVEQRHVAYQEAINSGVTALFGEKYGDFVRVITFGDDFSKELCGGTHVRATGKIGYFKIISESAVAAGVRRIEAITADKAEQFIVNQSNEIEELKSLFKNNHHLTATIKALIEENNQLKKEVDKHNLTKLMDMKHHLAKEVQTINGIHFLAKHIDLLHADAVKKLAYELKTIIPDLFLVITSVINDKPSITVMIAENLVKDKNLNAINIVKELGKEIQGGGGGQPFYATAGGKNADGLKNVLQKAITFVQ